MNDLPAVRLLLRVMINPGWAPFAVVFLHLSLASFGLTQKFDPALHFLGGAAIAFFLAGIIDLMPPPHAIPSFWLRGSLALAGACTVALFWEFAEFSSDRFMGTQMQQSLKETMLDLAYGVFGAVVTLAVLAVVLGMRRGSK